MERERKTVEAMIELYCRDHHNSSQGLCLKCRELADYARDRLGQCPFQEGKTTCTKCPVHCYKADMREEIRVIMRYAGPRMMKQHPLLSLFHFVDGIRKKPLRPLPKGGNKPH